MRFFGKRCFYLLLIALNVTYSCRKTSAEPIKLNGYAFGTTFSITYFDNKQVDYSKEIDSLFYLVNRSLSTYIPNSDISRINDGDTTIAVDDLFVEVYQKSQKIYEETQGVFDPTVGVLVNAWGFGPVGDIKDMDSVKVQKLLSFVGFDKVKLVNRRIQKIDSTYFDFNAIAKGYAVDVAGRFLENKNIVNYLVEIGGEVRCRGVNILKKANWKVGIEEPNFDGTRSLQKVIELKDEAIATSGSYRKFITDSLSGKRYVHILDPKTGFPIQSNLLSVSVIGKLDCADVDGYATAIMAMPVENAKSFFEQHKELRGFLIFNDENNTLQTYSTSNF